MMMCKIDQEQVGAHRFIYRSSVNGFPEFTGEKKLSGSGRIGSATLAFSMFLYMKFIVIPILFLLSCLSSYAQFAGHYTLTNTEFPELNFLLEEGGQFHIFNEEFYVTGRWKAINKDKVTLIYDQVDPVDFYAIRDTSESGSIYFYGFGDKKAWLHMDESDRYPNSFMAVYKERPACSYLENVSIRVNRKSLHKLTLAFHLPPDTAAGPNAPFDLYTCTIPAPYDAVYLVVNENAFSRPKPLTLELKDGKYIIDGKEVLHKQKAGQNTDSAWVADKIKMAEASKIKQFKNERYWLRKKVVEKIAPEVSRKTITINNYVLFEPECPDADAFPPIDVAAPR